MFLTPPTIGKRLIVARQEYGWERDVVASMGGISIPEYEAIERDEQEPNLEFLQKLEGNTNISSHWVMTGKGQMFTLSSKPQLPTHIHTESKSITLSDRDDVIMVPVLDQSVSAGPGQELTGSTFTDVTIPILNSIISPYPPQAIRVVEVRGDSMTGVNLFDGDFAIFVQGEVRSDGIYVISIGSDLFVKRLEFDPFEKKISIISENSHYEKKVVDADSELVRIEGKVIGWMHKHPY